MSDDDGGLAAPLGDWFAARGWQPRPHQRAMLALKRAGRDALLIAPTGAGKTLSGFLPVLDAHARQQGGHGLGALYLSPLKALAVDIARNLEAPINEIGLTLRAETRTGDTPQNRRQRQRRDPPDILLTTPEQLALLIASEDGAPLFRHLSHVIVDELHAMAASKRGDLLSLGLERLRKLAPHATMTGLSATVAEPDRLAAWLGGGKGPAEIVTVSGGARPQITILDSTLPLPFAGHRALHATPDLLRLIGENRMTLIFVNTRSQAEALFADLWAQNEATLAIALHHGALDVGQRRKVEAAMAQGRLRAVVATATLDLGIDWGDVDLVIHVGAPKGASRLAQRIGRSNHRMDEASRAVLVPANRFEVLECEAALVATANGLQDAEGPGPGALDVLCQHVLGMAVAGPFDADALYAEITGALPYRHLPRATFERALDFVATGGYALKTYERYQRIRQTKDGRWRVTNPAIAQQYRLNVGTIVENPLLKLRLVSARRPRSAFGGRMLGQVEEYFLETLARGDTFLFAGEVLALDSIVEDTALVVKSGARNPKVPAFAGGRFPLSTFLADGVRTILSDRSTWANLPQDVREWLMLQDEKSALPGKNDLLVESFAREDRFYLVLYPFEGRLAHQTLGMLLTRRLERAGAQPLGFVASDYALAIWGLRDFSALIDAGTLSLDVLFEEDMLGDDLEAWLADSAMMKRAFRTNALIAGLVEKRHPGKEKTGRQVTVSTDLVFDVLRRHEPDHILIEAAWADTARQLLDIARLGHMLKRVRGRIRHLALSRISPLAVPVILEIGREPIHGSAREQILMDAELLLAEAAGK